MPVSAALDVDVPATFASVGWEEVAEDCILGIEFPEREYDACGVAVITPNSAFGIERTSVVVDGADDGGSDVGEVFC